MTVEIHGLSFSACQEYHDTKDNDEDSVSCVCHALCHLQCLRVEIECYLVLSRRYIEGTEHIIDSSETDILAVNSSCPARIVYL